MKRIGFIVVLAMATFAITGVFAQSDQWYITNSDGGSRIRNNQVRLSRGDNYIYIYFRDGVPGGDFDKIQLDFTISAPAEVIWQAAYSPGQVWGSEESAGSKDKGPIENNFASFTKNWFGGGRALVKNQMTGMCLNIKVTSGSPTFVMTTVNFIR